MRNFKVKVSNWALAVCVFRNCSKRTLNYFITVLDEVCVVQEPHQLKYILLTKLRNTLRTLILGILPLHCTDSAYCFQDLAVLRYTYCPGFYPYCIFCNVERDSLCNNNRPISILSISHRSHSGLHNKASHHTRSSRNHTTHHHSLYLSHCRRPSGSNHRCNQVSHSQSSRPYSPGNLRCLHSSPIHHYRTLSTST